MFVIRFGSRKPEYVRSDNSGLRWADEVITVGEAADG